MCECEQFRRDVWSARRKIDLDRMDDWIWENGHLSEKLGGPLALTQSGLAGWIALLCEYKLDQTFFLSDVRYDENVSNK